MISPIVPQYILDRGLVSIERVGHAPMRSSWKVDTVDMVSRILRNTLIETYDMSQYRDRMVSGFGLCEYGPPEYEYSSTEHREGHIILVEVRKYVSGATLEEISQFMTDSELESMSGQLGRMVLTHGTIVSSTYGGMGYAGNGKDRLMDYMRHVRSFHVCTGNVKCRIRRLRTPRSNTDAMLCHNNLTPDHIIVHSGKIVSVIGWSHSDFGVMALQAASYAYRMDLSGSSNMWMSCVTCAILNSFSRKRDKLQVFCATMYVCRFPSNHPHPWLDSMISDGSKHAS